MAPHSFRVKHGNTTFVNDGRYPSTVSHINFAYESVNSFSKRSIKAKTTNSNKSLQEHQLDSLISTSATATSQKYGCVDSPPEWNLGTNSCGCPFPIINNYSCGLQSYTLNYTPGDTTFTITVNYLRCKEGNQSATSQKYKISDINGGTLLPNCFLGTPIACTPCNGMQSCADPASLSTSSCN